jgi:ABC-type antimicrobial peptide transport system permease subunit
VSGSTLANVNQSAASSIDPNQKPAQLYPGTPIAYPGSTPARFSNVDQILVRAASTPEIRTAIRQITEVLKERHRIKSGQPEDFNVRDMAEAAKAQSSVSDLITRFLVFVALVSLVVGGIGIMNIMLVSVTERTKEIGLRMAVGARARDILLQFLVEAVVLCLMGGLLGILFGRGAAEMMSLVLHWPTELSMPAIIAAVAVSGFVGVAFGYYPAWKASRLDPIEALRYE